MRIVFAGTPDFAAIALDAIVRAAPGAGWTVPLVLTQPDRPAGRGLKSQASPVKQLALVHGIEVDTPSSLRKGEAAAAALARLQALAPDVLVVAAYGLILPQPMLDLPGGLRIGSSERLSALNIHASLLPRWRGAAPIARAIEAGDAETGITLMQMDAGLDTGAMLAAEKVAIAPEDTVGTLTPKLAHVGARLVIDALLNPDRLVPTPQPTGATYAAKLSKAEAWLDWSQSAEHLQRKVRAFDPFPVASSQLNGSTVRVWRAQAIGSQLADASATGVVTGADAAGVRVRCGSGELLMTELQRAGGKRVAAREFIRGFPINVGDRFVSPQLAAAE